MHKGISPEVKNEHDEYAGEYDSLAKQYEYHFNEIIFGSI